MARGQYYSSNRGRYGQSGSENDINRSQNSSFWDDEDDDDFGSPSYSAQSGYRDDEDDDDEDYGSSTTGRGYSASQDYYGGRGSMSQNDRNNRIRSGSFYGDEDEDYDYRDNEGRNQYGGASNYGDPSSRYGQSGYGQSSYGARSGSSYGNQNYGSQSGRQSGYQTSGNRGGYASEYDENGMSGYRGAYERAEQNRYGQSGGYNRDEDEEDYGYPSRYGSRGSSGGRR